jgi:catalase (peroxidase I)
LVFFGVGPTQFKWVQRLISQLKISYYSEKNMDGNDVGTAGKCPVMHTSVGGRSNRDWWPNQLNLKMLHQNSALSDPLDASFN